MQNRLASLPDPSPVKFALVEKASEQPIGKAHPRPVCRSGKGVSPVRFDPHRRDARATTRLKLSASGRLTSLLLLLVVVYPALATAQTIDPLAGSTRLPRTILLLFHGTHGETLPVKSKANWLKRRQEVLHGMQEVMGPLPDKPRRKPPGIQVEAETDCGSYLRRLITYESEPGSSVPAYLLIPKEALGGRKKLPAVLALHPTDMQFGHRVLVEQVNKNYRVYANELAERGFVVLAPAYPVMANYQPDLKALGYESGTMKAIWDNLRGLDLLDSLRFVKRGQYGALGHSLGGHNAIYTAVFDPRIKVIVSSCGFDSFLDYYGGDPKNWQPGRGWCQTRYMLKLAEYRGRLEDIPFDFHELIGALAPRPVFINAPLGDSNFKAGSVDEIVKSASAVYRLYRAEKDLRVEHPDCGHDFPQAQREQAYRLLEDQLR